MSDEAVRETLTDGEKEDLASQAGGRQVIRTREARIRSARDRVVRVARKLHKTDPEHIDFWTVVFALDAAVERLNKLEAKR